MEDNPGPSRLVHSPVTHEGTAGDAQHCRGEDGPEPGTAADEIDSDGDASDASTDTDFADEPLPREPHAGHQGDELHNPDPEPDPDPDDPSSNDEASDNDENDDNDVPEPLLEFQSQDVLIQRFAEKFASVRSKVLASHAIAEAFYDFITENKDLIGSITNFPKVYKTMRRRADKQLPPIFMTFLIRDLTNQEEFEIGGESFDEKNYGDPTCYHVIETWARVELEDVMDLMDSWHNRQYPDGEQPWKDRSQEAVSVDLSWDGVSMDRKVDQVLESLAVKRTDCNRVVSIGEWPTGLLLFGITH